MEAANSELGAGAKPGKKRGSASELRQRLDAAKEITMLFKMERYVYIGLLRDGRPSPVLLRFQVIADQGYSTPSL